MKTKAEAVAAARHVRQLLNRPKGWKIHVWKNEGWSWNLRNGPMSLHRSFDGKMFALLSDHIDNPIGGSMMWTVTYTHANPNRVLANQIEVAKKRLAELKQIDAFLDTLL